MSVGGSITWRGPSHVLHSCTFVKQLRPREERRCWARGIRVALDRPRFPSAKDYVPLLEGNGIGFLRRDVAEHILVALDHYHRESVSRCPPYQAWAVDSLRWKSPQAEGGMLSSFTLLLVTLSRCCCRAEEFTIGYLANIQGERSTNKQGIIISGAISYAVDKINQGESALTGGHTLRLIYNDTKGDRLTSTRAVIDQWRAGSVAFFGPEDSCDVEATVATSLNLPMISYKCADSKVSKKEVYTSFARTQPPDKRIARSVISLLRYYQWFKFSIISERNAQGKALAESLEAEAERLGNFTINSKRVFEEHFSCCETYKDCCEKGFINIIDETYKTTRVYVFMGNTRDLMKMLMGLRMKGLLDTGQYLVIYMDLETYTESQSYRFFWHSGMSPDQAELTREAARSLLVIVPSPPQGQDYTDFEEKVRAYNLRPPFNFSDPFAMSGMKKLKLNRKGVFRKQNLLAITRESIKREFEKLQHITVFGAYLYDSVMLYAEALDTVLKSNQDPRNGTDIIRRIIAMKKYQSVTGAWMQIDENGDTEGNYTVLARRPVLVNLTRKGFNDTSTQRHKYAMLPVGSFHYDDNSNFPVFKLQSPIDWVSGRPPLEEPPCGFDGTQCLAPPDKNREIAASVLGSLLVIVSLVAAITYRNWKYEQEIAGLLWKIDFRDIQRGNPDGLTGCPSKMSLASQVTTESRVFQPVYTQTAIYKGTWVAVKPLHFNRKTGDIPRETKKEMKLMREIHNDNINPFIGACVEPTGIIIVTEYCAKGSLQDILENSNIKLDNMFIASLVFDLIKAMIYLHESDLKVHGNLKSSNCLVTSRWLLQVTDFGVHELRASAARDDFLEEQHFRNLLWKAPELLRNPTGHPKGTQKADVYSFAIILHEIIGRQGPFGTSELPPPELVSKVKEGVPEPFRPTLVGLECQDFVLQTMKDCWTEKPESRPDFRHIRQKLSRMKEGMKSSIMDNMMAMMEKYADNLEELVVERTAQLVEEQKKTEALLHRMLPKSVAQELMRGEAVIPEAFDAVTIYFSDIVGFTEMSANSTPMEVVTFLNDLYTVFDDIIAHYDVYKVETIGDAYMVVSGLPLRNGDRHASEIATMALELLDSIRAFRIRHRPNQTLKLRIGLHTGPVVAGVVGLTMPRYCLFGDTVNTASRMESNGEALRIHVSPDCQSCLERLGGYILKERGLVKMKGKGELRTYWLEGLSEGPLHRRDVRELVLPPVQPLFPPVSLGRRSPKPSMCEGLVRRCSLAVRHDSGGLWAAAGNNLDDAEGVGGHSQYSVPAFLRLQQHEASPRTSPQHLRDARLSRLREARLREAANDSSASCDDIPYPKEGKRNGFLVGGEEYSRTPLLPQPRAPLLPVREEKRDNQQDRYRVCAPLLQDGGASSKKWKSCDAIAFPKGPPGIRGLLTGLLGGKRLDLEHRRGSNPTVGLYRAKPDKLFGESEV